MNDSDPFSELPDQLQADLGKLRQPVPIPQGFDDDLLTAAHRRMASRRTWRWFKPAAVAGVAAAAAVLLLIVHVRTTPTNHSVPGQYVLGSAPTNSVDILAAYRLAYALKQGIHPTADWDRDHDGKFDQRDVDAWAAAAVALPRESP